jgi:hypothetical protein
MIKGNPLTRPRVAATREQVDIEKHFIFAPRRHPAIARSRIYPRFLNYLKLILPALFGRLLSAIWHTLVVDTSIYTCCG